MNWELFWAALGSLSTMAACIIAIFQPSFQKIITKKKIITSFRTDMKAFAPFAPDMVNEKMCTVSITNDGYNSIFRVFIIFGGIPYGNRWSTNLCKNNPFVFGNKLTFTR